MECHSVQDHSSSRLLSDNLNILIFYTKLQFYLLFGMSMKLSLSQTGNSTDCGCLSKGC
jgi:hypothetical protein